MSFLSRLWGGGGGGDDDDDARAGNGDAGQAGAPAPAPAPELDPDEMRKRRLAKFQSNADGAGTPTDGPLSSPAPPATKRDAVAAAAPSPVPTATPTPAPVAAVPVPAPVQRPAVPSSSASPGSASPSLSPAGSVTRVASQGTPESKRAVRRARSSEHTTISRITHLAIDTFEHTVFPTRKLLPDSALDFVDKERMEFTIHNYVEILTLLIMSEHSFPDGRSTALSYLSDCFERATAAAGDNDTLCASVKKSLVTLACTTLLEPDTCISMQNTLGQAISGAEALVSCYSSDSLAISSAFLAALGAELVERGAAVAQEFVTSIVTLLFTRVQAMTVADSFMPSLAALNAICACKPLAKLVVNTPHFLPPPGYSPTGLQFQQYTLFERFPPKPQNEYHAPAVQSVFSEFRAHLTNVNGMMRSIILSLCKAAPDARERVLRWFHDFLAANADRAKMQPNQFLLAGDETLQNVFRVLLLLVEPVLAPDKLKQVKPLYIEAAPKLYPPTEERLCPQEGKVADHTPVPAMSDFDFSTSILFLALRAWHIGVAPTVRRMMEMQQSLGFLQNHQADNEQYRLQFEAVLAMYVGQETGLLQPEFVVGCARFHAAVGEWLAHVCSNDYDGFRLPFPAELSRAAMPLREWFADNIIDYLAYAVGAGSQQLSAVDLGAFQAILHFIVAFMASPQHIRNPHVRAKFGDVLFDAFLPSFAKPRPPQQQAQSSSVVDRASAFLASDRLALEYLCPCLVALYGDVEHTGIQDAIRHRYKIACILQYLWKFEGHRTSFLSVANDKERFVSFANGLLNQSNKAVNEALSALTEVKSTLDLMLNRPAEWMALEDEARASKQKALEDNKRLATDMLMLGNETIALMARVTEHIQEQFLCDEIIDRLAGFVADVIARLTGPRGIQLKVDNPEQYNFRPKQMLQDMCTTLTHMATHDAFVTAFIRAELADANTLRKMLAILRRTGVADEEQRTKLQDFVDVIEARSRVVAAESDIWADVRAPDEFFDPLMGHVMTDPVTLPVSGVNLDRSTIVQCLLNKEMDPYSNTPLTIDQVKPNDELRAQIEAWKKDHEATA